MKKEALPGNTGSNRRSLAEIVLASTHQAVVVIDKLRHRVVYANPAFVTLTGYTLMEIKGKSLAYLWSGRHNAAFYQQIWKALEETGQWSGEVWTRRRNGDEQPTLHTISPIYDSRTGRVTGYVSVFCDISALKRQQSSLGDLAFQDALTGLPNRLLLFDRLQQALHAHTRTRSCFAVLLLDLDNFKQVNDTLGHAAGDALLQAVAERLLSALRTNDTVARLGGDEFVIIAGACPEREDVVLIAEKILRKLGDPVEIQDRQVTIEASIGIAVVPDDGRQIDTLLHAADQAMYGAKLHQGSSYCFHSG